MELQTNAEIGSLILLLGLLTILLFSYNWKLAILVLGLVLGASVVAWVVDRVV